MTTLTKSPPLPYRDLEELQRAWSFDPAAEEFERACRRLPSIRLVDGSTHPIDENGIVSRRKQPYLICSPPRQDEVEAFSEWLKRRTRRTSTFPTTAYGLKHEFEHETDTYITSGAALLGLAHNEIQMKRANALDVYAGCSLR